MANVAFIKDGAVEYRMSIDPTPFMVDPTAPKGSMVAKSGAVFNPNISALINVPRKYWKIADGQVLEMDVFEKQIVDETELLIKETATQNFDNLTALVLAKALVSAGLITKPKMITEIKKFI